MPPLCVMGFGLGSGANLEIMGGAGLLFLTNLVAIVASAFFIFLLVGLNAAEVQTVMIASRKDNFLGRLFSHASIERMLTTGGRLRWRIVMILILLAAISVPLRRALRGVTSETFTRGVIQEVLKRLAPPGTLVSQQVSIVKDGIIIHLISTKPILDARVAEARQELMRRTRQDVQISVEAVASKRELAAIMERLTRQVPEVAKEKTIGEMQKDLLDRVRPELQGIWPSSEAPIHDFAVALSDPAGVSIIVRYEAAQSLGDVPISMVQHRLQTSLGIPDLTVNAVNIQPVDATPASPGRPKAPLTIRHFKMELDVQTGALLLLLAAVVAMVTRRLRLPYSVGLVVAGICLAALPFAPNVNLTKDLIFTVLLPPLLFEAAFYLDWGQLRRDFSVVLVLATLGVVLSAGVTALGMHYLADWNWMSAFVFGVLIAATDPVSVIAAFKEAKVHGRLLVLIEAESLFNDGTAAVAFGVAVAMASGGHLNSLGVASTLVKTIGGGILCGAIVSILALLLAGRTEDHLVEITFTTVAAYGSFLLAEHFGLSGVLATITAGLLMGNLRLFGGISEKGEEAIQAFWEYAAFVANSLIFLLIGMHEAHQNFGSVWRAALIAILLVVLGRAVAIYPCCLLFSRSSLRVTINQQHILFWGGMRGAVALALALGLPQQLPERETIVTISFAVVAFSVFAQGLTITSVLRRMGEISPDLKMLHKPKNGS